MSGLKYDDGKPRMDLLPFDALVEVAKILTFGAQKYEKDSWREVDNGMDRYTAALLRHLAAGKSGEFVDKESGLNHMSHIACNALFMCALEMDENNKLKTNESSE